LSKTSSPNNPGLDLVAAVDLGSNSFRLLICQAYITPSGMQLRTIDTLREPVRLAAGLSPGKVLDEEAMERGLDAIRRFGERLRGFKPEQVRAVATNTFRVARNAQKFVQEAQIALGFPIEVIAGVEEARLIYIGTSHEAPAVSGNRLVIDVGGGSSEFIIGKGYEPKLLESLYIGCVSHSIRFFPNGAIDPHSFKEAELAARREVQVIKGRFNKSGWNQVIGSSGTARALADLIADNKLNGSEEKGTLESLELVTSGIITIHGLKALKRKVLDVDHIDRIQLINLKDDRRPVLPGGLSIMLAIFDEFGIEKMEVSDAALRVGVLYDLLGRTQHHDMRFVTVEQFMQRYSVDREQAHRLGTLAAEFLAQLPKPNHESRTDNLSLLGWSANLHEVGLSISHNSYHKHSAYIAANADMPGFSKNDQARLAALLIGHTGKLGKLSNNANFSDWRMLFCIRLAHVLCRSRSDENLPKVKVKSPDPESFEVQLNQSWAEAHPLTEFSLRKEAAEWERIGYRYSITLSD
jgi:exopolyphosphatase / guanosine-5'-triphosphate,3'-diphosphate pyrophosphatase